MLAWMLAALVGVLLPSITEAPHLAPVYSGADPLLAALPHSRDSASGPTELQAISCPTRLRCIAVGGNSSPYFSGPRGPQIFRTTNGGATWSSQTAPPNTTGLEGVSCPTATWCLAEGPASAAPQDGPYWSLFIRSTDGGSSWTTIKGHQRVDPPVCATVSRCYENDYNTAFRSTDGGTVGRDSRCRVGMGSTRSSASEAPHVSSPENGKRH